MPAESTSAEDRARAAQAIEELTASLVRLALSEDIGPGDETTLATIDAERRAVGLVRAKEAGVLSGLLTTREIVRVVDADIVLSTYFRDGEPFSVGDVILRLEGKARSLLTMERVLLNFLQRLSGVATLTRRFVEAVEGTGVAIADTRKTTPGLRFLEKMAVRHGGGTNHRMGLYDVFMVKDNHILAAGGLTRAVERIRRTGKALPIVVEAASPAEVEEAANLEVDQILLDNMSPEEIAEAVHTIRTIERARGQKPVRIEVSGGVTLDTVREKAIAGVDLISVGALTHSAGAIDLSLDLALEGLGA